jgi:hypothetical protein
MKKKNKKKGMRMIRIEKKEEQGGDNEMED